MSERERERLEKSENGMSKVGSIGVSGSSICYRKKRERSA